MNIHEHFFFIQEQKALKLPFSQNLKTHLSTHIKHKNNSKQKHHKVTQNICTLFTKEHQKVLLLIQKQELTTTLLK